MSWLSDRLSPPSPPGPPEGTEENIELQNELMREQLQDIRETRERLQKLGPQTEEDFQALRDLQQQEQELAKRSLEIQEQMFADYQRNVEEGRPVTEAQRRIALLQAERLEKALKGELPVSPGLERSLEEQEQQLKEELSAQLGPNFAETTAGIQRLEEFRARSEAIREQVRTGEITSGAAINFQQQGLSAGSQANQFSQLASFRNVPQQRIGQVASTATFGFPETFKYGQQQYGLLESAQQRRAQYQAGQNELYGTILGFSTKLGAFKLGAA
jgi:hypothetical protein